MDHSQRTTHHDVGDDACEQDRDAAQHERHRQAALLRCLIRRQIHPHDRHDVVAFEPDWLGIQKVAADRGGLGPPGGDERMDAVKDAARHDPVDEVPIGIHPRDRVQRFVAALDQHDVAIAYGHVRRHRLCACTRQSVRVGVGHLAQQHV
ncbi:hypothetical protein AB0B52_28835 [Streptomyces griseofuscus]|uniref:hypothetical protein n=1 Tax=Streptomyces griseofuscus TaxID=146922 RepID=UPI0033D64B22